MSLFVVDASVVLKWFVPEIHSEEARRLLTASHQYIAPDLIFPEVGNAIWKKVRRGELIAREGLQLIGDLAGIAIETVATRELIGDACSVAFATGQTVYDATYVALAVRLKTSLITADDRLQKSLAAYPAVARYVCRIQDFC